MPMNGLMIHISLGLDVTLRQAGQVQRSRHVLSRRRRDTEPVAHVRPHVCLDISATRIAVGKTRRRRRPECPRL